MNGVIMGKFIFSS